MKIASNNGVQGTRHKVPGPLTPDVRRENMKYILIAIVLLFSTTCCYADIRIIGVNVTVHSNADIRVSIYSDIQEENRGDLTLEQACTIIENAKGLDSVIWVGVIAHQVPLGMYLPLLETISHNGWMRLAFVEGEKSNYIHDIVTKKVEQGGPGYPPQGVGSPDP